MTNSDGKSLSIIVCAIESEMVLEKRRIEQSMRRLGYCADPAKVRRHLPRLYAAAEITAPSTQGTSREIDRDSGLPLGHVSHRLYHARMYATGTRRTIVVNREIHMGVTVSPAPRIIPPNTWDTAMAMYPADIMLIIL